MFDNLYLKAPFLEKRDIWKKADDFRNEYWPDGTLPIDIESIIEKKLLLEIRPLHRLRESSDIDALLLGNNKGIIVDQEEWMNEKMENRMRFSFAHEIGHYILHENIYKNCSYESPEEWKKFQSMFSEKEHSFVEYHANEFAGRLLVPVERLKEDFQEAVNKGIKEGITEWIGAAKEYIASQICRKYGVSDQVISRRLDKEDLWPPPVIQ